MVLVTPTVALARSLARSVGRFMTRAFISLPVRKRPRLIPFTLHTHARLLMIAVPNNLARARPADWMDTVDLG